MWSIVEYLKRPELVVSVQEWFGIEYLNDENKDVSIETNKTNKFSDKLHKFNSNNDLNGIETRLSYHKRNASNLSTDSSDGKYCDTEAKGYRITNKFWYFLFVIGTEFGDEIFYATMIPFWFWNIDGAVGRRVVFVWSVVMYIGQGLKDIIRWQRPGLPVHRLQSKWSVEYGMPSTHAMVIIIDYVLL